MSTERSKLALLDLLVEEYAARYRRGERPALEEYVRRHPELEDELREYLPAVAEMEQVEAGRAEATAEPPAVPLRQVGDYTILREVGRGGMGVVYEAEQRSLGRRVALKILPLRGGKDGVALERFRREARTAARLHHTNIVPVFEVGQDGEICFFAMQFIQGQPLDEVIQELARLRDASATPGGLPVGAGAAAQSLLSGAFTAPANAVTVALSAAPATTPAAPPATGPAALPGRPDMSSAGRSRSPYYRSVAQLGQQVAQALAYAHGRGIVHRDVKPSNLLLDAAGTVWVSDFGLAKTGEDALTRTGDLLGTLRYMAPERFHGECDARADLYALGLTLYEMLTLRPAFAAPDQARLVEDIRTREPPRPRSADPGVPRDLETIVLKAIEKEPARRYAGAEEMGRDLRRFLDDEPIRARRVGPAERLWRMCRRNRLVASLAALVLALLCAAAVGSTVAALWLEQALTSSRDAEHRANERLWESLVAQARGNLLSGRPGQRFDTLEAVAAALRLPVPPGRSRDELRTHAIAALMLPDLKVDHEIDDAFPVGTNYFAVDPTFRSYARSNADASRPVTVHRLADGAEVLRLTAPGLAEPGGTSLYNGLIFSPDGRFLHQFRDGEFGRLWRIDGPSPRIVCEGSYRHFHFSPDSRQLATLRPDGVRLIDTESGRERRRYELDLREFHGVHWNPRRDILLLSSAFKSWSLLDLQTGLVVARCTALNRFRSASWHPDGERLAVLYHDQSIQLWDAHGRGPTGPPLAGGGPGTVCQVDPTGERVFGSDWSKIWRVWDANTGRQWFTQPAGGVAFHFSPDGRRVGLDLAAPKLRAFRYAPGTEFRTLGLPPGKSAGRFEGRVLVHPDGRLLAACLQDGVALADLKHWNAVTYLPTDGSVLVGFEPDGGALLTNNASTLQRWPLREQPTAEGSPDTLTLGPPEVVFSGPRGFITLAADAGTSLFAEASGRDAAHLWKRGDASPFRALGPQGEVRHCAVSPDGRWVATGSHGVREGVGAKVWDAGGTLVTDLPLEDARVWFSPDGRWLLTSGRRIDSAGASNLFRLWSVGDWREGPPLGGSHFGAHSSGVFSADGKLLALGDELSVVRLVETASGRELARLTIPESTRVHPKCFTPDGGTLLVLGSESRALHRIDLRAIRAGLAELGLDWDQPPLPPAPPSPSRPLRIVVEKTTGG